MSKEFDAQLKHHAELSARSLLLLAKLEKKLKQVNQLVSRIYLLLAQALCITAVRPPKPTEIMLAQLLGDIHHAC